MNYLIMNVLNYFKNLIYPPNLPKKQLSNLRISLSEQLHKNLKKEFIQQNQKGGDYKLKYNKITKKPRFSKDEFIIHQKIEFLYTKTIDFSIHDTIQHYKLITNTDNIPHGGYAIVVFYVNVDDETDTFVLK